jgi:hypothetical protein
MVSGNNRAICPVSRLSVANLSNPPASSGWLFSFNLHRYPYERAQITSNTYYDWLLDRVYLLVPAQAYVREFLGTFKDYPPRMKAASFSLDKVMVNLSSHGGAQ